METPQHRTEAGPATAPLYKELKTVASVQRAATAVLRYVRERMGERVPPEVLRKEALYLLIPAQLHPGVEWLEVAQKIKEMTKALEEETRVEFQETLTQPGVTEPQGPEAGQPTPAATGTFGRGLDQGGAAGPGQRTGAGVTATAA